MPKDYTTVKVYRETHKLLKKLSAETEQQIAKIVARLVKTEAETHNIK